MNMSNLTLARYHRFLYIHCEKNYPAQEKIIYRTAGGWDTDLYLLGAENRRLNHANVVQPPVLV